jgi:lysophospholipase L1-like esterase
MEASMRRTTLWTTIVTVLLAVAGGMVAIPSAQAAPPRPSAMAAIGDSMTMAADVCCWYGDHPANSWSTGGAGWDGIISHYERLRVLNPAITGHNYNDAKSGARMSDAPGQAQAAVSQQAGYVTILMGANDVCTSSPATMTPVDTFRDQFRQTLQTLATGHAQIFVASIPDVYHLWEIYHTDFWANLVWDAANICQSLLAPNRTAAERQAVRDRSIAFNRVLREECAAFPQCRYDDDATFNYQFSRSQVSKLDYFHPSLSGQAALAQLSWTQSWWS